MSRSSLPACNRTTAQTRQLDASERSIVKNSRYSGRQIVITGGTGSFVHRVARKFLEADVDQYQIPSRDEAKQVATRHEIPDSHPPAEYQMVGTSRRVVNLIRSVEHSHHQRAGTCHTEPRV